MNISPKIFDKAIDSYTDSCLLGSQIICELLIKAKNNQHIGLKDALTEAIYLIQNNHEQRGAALSFLEGIEHIFEFAVTKNVGAVFQPVLKFYELEQSQKLQATQQKNKYLLAELN